MWLVLLGSRWGVEKVKAEKQLHIWPQGSHLKKGYRVLGLDSCWSRLGRTKSAQAAPGLSLIHISEPTRPKR